MWLLAPVSGPGHAPRLPGICSIYLTQLTLNTVIYLHVHAEKQHLPHQVNVGINKLIQCKILPAMSRYQRRHLSQV